MKYETLFLELLNELETARFRDFQKRIGANDRTIREVLNRLIEQRLAVKDDGIRPTYRITQKGRLALLEHREIDAVRKFYAEKRYEPTAREIIDVLLLRKGPMHFKKLAETLSREKLTGNIDAEKDVLTILEWGVKTKPPKYIRVGNGVYSLNFRKVEVKK